ncbi:MAG TPA: hypothetical protein VKB41_15935 [Steroidobacteraceae bacterium]|nr:hypothetical protein [Steroidobacteraceae bacterium]
MTAARRTLGIVLCTLLAGCATFQAYDGERRATSDVAVISGDAKLRATTPFALVIRSVDGRNVDVRYSSVALLPGKHSLLIDCQVGTSGTTASRHELDVEVEAGEHYRLQAEMRPGNQSCERVDLEPS